MIYIFVILLIAVICFDIIEKQLNYSENDKYWLCVNGYRNRKHISRNNECEWAIVSESKELVISTTYVVGCNKESHTILSPSLPKTHCEYCNRKIKYMPMLKCIRKINKESS